MAMVGLFRMAKGTENFEVRVPIVSHDAISMMAMKCPRGLS